MIMVVAGLLGLTDIKVEGGLRDQTSQLKSTTIKKQNK